MKKHTVEDFSMDRLAEHIEEYQAAYGEAPQALVVDNFAIWDIIRDHTETAIAELMHKHALTFLVTIHRDGTPYMTDEAGKEDLVAELAEQEAEVFV